ncbi:hypothetical protein Ddye_022708 [Dipteronia dyeriana]|uniref:Uncharacterized protein n=1 Tax=Dipteronia dyeriana TaxID=168575 RepID=A0AAD9TSG9_9ROSI|nr:hypothetical protein Ddye_022708 [Dipteronia dyeriana]
MDGEENLALTWNENEMDVEENLELTWDDAQMDEEENLGLRKFMNNSVENQKVCNKFMQQVSTNEKCHDIIRMSPLTFARLCELLRDTNRLKDIKNTIVDEQVAKFFDCIGTIDGTHIRVKVSKDEAARYRERKDYTTQTVMAACVFDMRFTYMLPRWEGTASLIEMAKKAKINVEGCQPKKDTVKWTESMDVVLFDTLLEKQANGNRIDRTFTISAYNNVLKICRKELKYPFDKDHLKNRIKTLKINFNACYDLFKGLSGFS